MCFADAWRTQKKDILGLADEVAGGQIINVFSVDARTEPCAVTSTRSF